jgi:hypothetical protein
MKNRKKSLFYEEKILVGFTPGHKFFLHVTTRSQSYQTFFFVNRRFFLLFASKLGYFNVLTIFSYATNTQALQLKTEKNLHFTKKKVW